jgi:hypothetical protein
MSNRRPFRFGAPLDAPYTATNVANSPAALNAKGSTHCCLPTTTRTPNPWSCGPMLVAAKPCCCWADPSNHLSRLVTLDCYGARSRWTPHAGWWYP